MNWDFALIMIPSGELLKLEFAFVVFEKMKSDETMLYQVRHYLKKLHSLKKFLMNLKNLLMLRLIEFITL